MLSGRFLGSYLFVDCIELLGHRFLASKANENRTLRYVGAMQRNACLRSWTNS